MKRKHEIKDPSQNDPNCTSQHNHGRDDPNCQAHRIEAEIEARLRCEVQEVSNDPFVSAAVAGAVARTSPPRTGITNTAEMATNDPMSVLTVQATTGRAIERLEERGQRELVAQRALLPKDGILGEEEEWESIGIRIKGVVTSDPIFIEVELPDGWKIEATDHSMWSDLVDNHDNVRAKMFYKAAFYDRSAHIILCQRFKIRDKWNGTAAGADSKICAYILDSKTGSHVFTTEYFRWDGFKTTDLLEKEARAWLDENYPDWESPVAYWEEP